MIDWIGSAGFGILLLTFLLNLTRRLSSSSAYQGLNALGAALACVGDGNDSPYYPFVVLEGTW